MQDSRTIAEVAWFCVVIVCCFAGPGARAASAGPAREAPARAIAGNRDYLKELGY